MRNLVLTVVVGLVISVAAGATSAGAATPTARLMAPVVTFMDTFNKGDAAGAAATHAPDVTIVDEIPPHLWRGPKAFETWNADLLANDKAHGITGETVTLGKTQRALIDGDTGYVVIKAVYTYTEKGVPMTEPATMTFSLKSGKDGWKITAWSWDGTVPKAAAAR